MSKSLALVMAHMSVNGAEPYDSSAFLDALGCCWESYKEQTQMDAQEFFAFLLNTLHDELKTKVGSSPVHSQEDMSDLPAVVVNRWFSREFSSPIGLLFHVQTVTLLFCPTCNFQQGQYADMTNHLSLLVKCSIEECFKSFSVESVLEDGRCSSCGALGVKHRLLLGRLPPLLVVHLNRFQYIEDKNRNCIFSKINCNVEFSATLNLEPFTVEGIQSSHCYKLLGVTNHHGQSINRGHYTSVISRGDRLYNFDDSRVSNTTARKLTSPNSYLLWYEIIEGDGTLPLDVERRSVVTTALTSTPHSHDLTPSSNECMNADVMSAANAQRDNSKDDSFSVTDESDTDNSNQSEDIFEDVDDFNKSMNIQNLTFSGNCSVDIFQDIDDINISTNIQNLTMTEQDLSLLNDHTSQEQPHSPLQCNHREFDLDIMDPVLSEEEVPGAKLNMENLENCKKSDLERWLLCRRINKSGNKQELISRIMNHQKTNKSKLIFPGIDGGKWYELKRKKLMEQVDTLSQRLPMMPLGLSVFKSFPSAHIPNGFSFDKATEYLQQIPLTRFSYENGVQSVECEPDEEYLLDFSQPSDDVRKNLFVNGTMQRANQFVNSGRVLSVMDCERGDHYFIKADVHASYRNHIYKISVMISKRNGSVCFAECCCKAKALGRCCHIMAVLILISLHVQKDGHEGYVLGSTTSKVYISTKMQRDLKVFFFWKHLICRGKSKSE